MVHFKTDNAEIRITSQGNILKNEKDFKSTVIYNEMNGTRNLEGCGEGARRRAPPDDIDFVPSPARVTPTPALSIRPRVLSSRAYGHLRQKLRLNDMTPQLKIPTCDPRAASPRRSLMNPPAESHSVEIALPPRDALVHAGGKNKLFVTIKMVNQTNFSNCEVKL
ncbi:jg19825 [Pararge aegeria aegeria]|uniref:Jg19825 protein n=1 Tax=Pararge aegeria aegeria TaxID=348720 RepID=A0A8S4SCH3_9NEOP|nr:jg19825 [Pararge aegeria aegeria]